MYKVRFYSELLKREVIKNFDSLKEAFDFAHKVGGILVG